MRTREFVWNESRPGWKPVDPPNFDAGGPVVVAHDTIEHFNNKPDFKHELMAFGSTLFGRAAADSDMLEVMASDLAGFLMLQKMKVKKAPKRWAKPLPARDEARLNRMLQLTNHNLLFAILFGRVSESAVKRAIVNSAPWIRLGWRVAQRRFRGHTQLEVNGAFKKLFDAVANDHDLNMPIKGDKLKISFDPATLKFNLERSHDETV